MTDFDEFLGKSLAPEERDPDRLFVARVQAGIRLNQQLGAYRRATAARLGQQAIGLAAIAGGFLVLARAPAVAEFAIASPAIAVAGLLAAFGFVVAVFSGSGGPRALATG